jgi:hypothetical protein
MIWYTCPAPGRDPGILESGVPAGCRAGIPYHKNEENGNINIKKVKVKQ